MSISANTTDIKTMLINRFLYIILAEVTHISDHTDPDKHGADAEEDAAHVITREDLEVKIILFLKID